MTNYQRITLLTSLLSIAAICIFPPWRAFASATEGREHPKDFTEKPATIIQEVSVGHHFLFKPPNRATFVLGVDFWMPNTPIYGTPKVAVGQLLAETMAIAAIGGVLFLLLGFRATIGKNTSRPIE